MVELRAATPDDAQAIATVHVASWRVAFRGLLPDDVLDNLSASDRTRIWAERLTVAAPRTGILLVVDGTAVLGFASTGPARGVDDDPTAGSCTRSTSTRPPGPAATGTGSTRASSTVCTPTASPTPSSGFSTPTRARCASTSGRAGRRPVRRRCAATSGVPSHCVSTSSAGRCRRPAVERLPRRQLNPCPSPL